MSCDTRDLRDVQKGAYKPAYKPAYKKHQKTTKNQLLNVPTELANIVAVWPELPDYIKAAIKALVQTYKESD